MCWHLANAIEETVLGFDIVRDTATSAEMLSELDDFDDALENGGPVNGGPEKGPIIPEC